MKLVIAIAGLAVAAVAAAEPKPELDAELLGLLNTGGPANDPLQIKPPRLILDHAISISPADYASVVDRPSDVAQYAVSSHPVIATAADGTAAWIAVDVAIRDMCAKASCDHDPSAATGHATALFEPGKPAWQPIAWDMARTLSAKDRKAKAATPAALERKVDAGAEDAVKQFEATIGDPVAFAKTVSNRKDVVLYGSELAERYVGGAAVRARLGTWKLAFKLRDGIQAGASSSKTVAFVAANVDAARAADKTATAYRAFAIYEKTDGAWQLVVLQFSAAGAR